MNSNPFRHLPSVTQILESAPVVALAQRHDHDRIVSAIRAELDAIRAQIKNAPASATIPWDEMVMRVADRLAKHADHALRPVINATGIVLHTNLGRAPIAHVAADAACEAAAGYLNLEMDLATGKRSSRQDAVRECLVRLTGAESATAVNNCAAATVIVLRALAQGKEAIVSRGQLIEIGGSFRIPEIMAVSGAILREVGTTNITRIGDYENAINDQTGLLMRIHASNYRLAGFTRAVSLSELVALGKKRGLPVVDDVGSGAMVDLSRIGFSGEPDVRESIATGADLVLFSGDKLLGGPQAGIIVGKQSLIRRIESDPLMRAFRLDKMTLAALEATLRLYLRGETVWNQVPVLKMLSTPLKELRKRAMAMAAQLRDIPGVTAVVRRSVAYAGGGSLPEQRMASAVIAVTREGLGETELAMRLRGGTPPVLGRVFRGRLVLDLRCVFPDQEPALVAALTTCLQN